MYGFALITSGSKLDEDKLNTTGNYISIVSADGNEFLSDDSTINIEDLNQYTIDAFVVKEDKRFYKHNGIDIIRIFGALKNNIQSGDVVEGGSTISQQLVKNTQLSQEKTIKRKLTEIKLAGELEDKYSKDDILEMYLNTIYFGNNCYGIQSASRFYFNKDAQDLSLTESAVLSGLISAPSKNNPLASTQNAQKMAGIVLDIMLEQEKISNEEYKDANESIINLSAMLKGNAMSTYMQYATAEALELLNLKSFPSNADVKIKTYLDLNIQEELNDKINSKNFNIKNEKGILPDVCSLVLDNKTGGIIAFDGKSSFNLIELKRQPASTIKPILVYAPAFEKGELSPASLILDEPIDINGYTPTNATKMYYGYTSVRESLIRSTNIPAVKTLQNTGIDYSKDVASKMGIKFYDEENNLALALGGFKNGVSFLDLASSYATLANGGKYIQPRFVKEISVNGNILYKNDEKQKYAISDSTSYLLTDILIDVTSKGTARKIGKHNFDIASKTGSNYFDEINNDAWSISYTTEHTFLSWFGNTSGNNGSMNNAVNGSTLPTLLNKLAIEKCYEDYSPKNFEKPNSVLELQIDKNEYEKNHNIIKADDNSVQTLTEVFKKENAPQSKATLEEKLENIKRKNLFHFYMM